VADFVEALDEALHGFYNPRADYVSPITSTRGFKARVRALEKAYGSKRAAADAAGISRDTWSRWTTKGRTPTAASIDKVGSAHTSLLRAVRAAKKGAPGSIRISATVAVVPTGSAKSVKRSKYYNGGTATASGAHREFRADKLTGSQLRDVAGAWAAGRSPQTVADVLLDAIRDAYGNKFAFEGTNVTVDIT
jgi:hypothetical protein